MKKNTSTAYSIDEERRIQFERRQFSYADIYPERRSGKDRRLSIASVAAATIHRRGDGSLTLMRATFI
jgi:hypothetical protein